jgi:redox-sensitive bicupin YhaK (pirin superfamily)
MINVRRSKDRLHTKLDWLDSRHTFSFAEHYDPRHMGFRALRVINEDRVAAAKGFGTHSHREMEIISYVLEGSLRHTDSIGNGSVISRGDIQRMSAGTGVLHSESNASDRDPVHFLQIWVLPEKARLAPGYEQRSFTEKERLGCLRLVASRDGRAGSITVHQDLRIFSSLLNEGMSVSRQLDEGRHAWVQIARGTVQLNGTTLEAGDGASVTDEQALGFLCTADCEFLLFDLA